MTVSKRPRLYEQRITPGPLDTSSSPRAASGGATARLENMLLRGTGPAVMRGPVYGTKTAISSTFLNTTGTLPSQGNRLMVSRFTTSNRDTAVVTMPAMTVVTQTQAAAFQPYGRSAEVGGDTYVSESTGRMFKWAALSNTATGLVYAPFFAASVCSHLNRLFVLGGTTPGVGIGGPHGQATIYWTDIGGSATDVLTDWEDDVSGLVNQIQLASPTAAETGVALAQVGRYMAMFTTGGIWLLTGDTPSAFAVRRVITGLTAYHDLTVQEWDEGCFFLSPDYRVYFFDGVSAVDVSAPVFTDLQSARIFSSHLPTLARASDHHLVLSVGDGSLYLYDTRTRTWQTMVFPNVQVVGNTATQGAFIYDGTAVWPMTNISALASVTGPESTSTASRGFDHDGTGPVNTAIPTKWWSKVYDLTGPTDQAQIHRVFVDYDLRAATTIAGGQGLTVSLYDSLGNQLMAPQSLPQGTRLQRAQFDVFSEATDVQVRVEYANTSPTNVTKLEIYDVWVEYQIGRQKP